MKRAAAIVTNRGGRTCHAAIIARELGVPAVVGCGDATRHDRRRHRSDGRRAPKATPAFIYKGMLRFERSRPTSTNMPPAPLKIMMNVGNPERAFDFAHAAERRRRPGAPGNDHRPPDRRASEGAARIRSQAGCRTKKRRSTSEGRLCEARWSSTSTAWPRASRRSPAAFAPNPVIVRLSDFKSNEYANLIGGSQYEPHEENPMIGFRGASPLRRSELRGLLRARMPGDEEGARRDGPDQLPGS